MPETSISGKRVVPLDEGKPQGTASQSSGYLPQIQLDDDFDPVPVTAHGVDVTPVPPPKPRETSGPLTRAVLFLLLALLAGIAVMQIVQWQSPPSSAFVQRLDDKTFATTVLNGEPEQLWIVNFWSPRMARCREFVPVFNSTAETLQENASFASVRVENARDTARQMSVDLVPAVLAIRGGKEIDRVSGFQSEDELKAFVQQFAEKQ
jgi:hypothetical protein